MPVGFGIASSHAPAVYCELDEWEPIYKMFIGDVPQPREAALETRPVLKDYMRRINASLTTIQLKLAKYDPELLIIVGGDQSEMFDDSNVPNIMIYTGETAWGHTNEGLLPEKPPSDEDIVRLKIDVETSRELLHRLVIEEDFDVAFSTEQRGMGYRGDFGLPHAFMLPIPDLKLAKNLPVVLIYENTYDAPSLPASRCYQLGQALSRLLRDDPRRTVIFGSGGLSHDPDGARAGWVDEELDRWFLKQIATGNGKATEALYKFDSATMRGGTGEIRAWITVAGAMEEVGQRAEVLDYIPANHALTGLGFAYWVPAKSARGVARR